MKSFEIVKDVYWVGVLDPDLRIFDIVLPTEKGTTYNAYFVRGREKSALIDTVKEPFAREFMERLRTLTDLRTIDYLVVNHTEPDHSWAVQEVLKASPDITIIASRSAVKFLQAIVNRPFRSMVVTGGESVDLGDRTLHFIAAPFLHWPDTIFTYLAEDEILFPCDCFGCHFCDERMFEDQVDDFQGQFHFYYDHIMRPFKPKVVEACEKVKPLKIKILAPSHGPILRKDPWKYIRAYEEWSRSPEPETEALEVVIVYVSAYQNTRRMGEAIREGMSDEKVRVVLLDINATDTETLRDAIERADGLVVGTPTLAGDAPKPIWDVLSLIVTVSGKKRWGAVFGSYGWSGEAIKMVEERLKGLGIRLASSGLKVNFAPTEEDFAQCREFGRRFVATLHEARKR